MHLSLISIGGNGILAIDYHEIENAKNDLKRAKDINEEVSRRIKSARLKLQADNDSSRIRIAEDNLDNYYRNIGKMQTSINNMINKLDRVERRVKEVDKACAAKINAIGAEKKAAKKKGLFGEITSFGEGAINKVGGLLEEGKEAFGDFCGTTDKWLDDHPIVENIGEAALDVVAMIGTAAAITAGGPAILVGAAVIGFIYAANSFLDEGTKIYNNISNGTNKGYNTIETGLEDVLGKKEGEEAYGIYNIVGAVACIGPLSIDAAKGIMELGKGMDSILKEGEAAKGLLSVEEDSSELLNEAETGIKGVGENVEGDSKITSKLVSANDNIKEILEKAGLNQEKIDEIVSLPKSEKPIPETYLSKDYIDTHLQSFKDSGIVKIMAEPRSGTIGGRGGTFVMSGDELNNIIEASNGDVSYIEDALGFDRGYLGNDPVICKFDSYSGLRMPQGNELGAYPEYWMPGGYTSGGIKEAVIDPAKEGTYSFEHVFKGGK